MNIAGNNGAGDQRSPIGGGGFELPFQAISNPDASAKRKSESSPQSCSLDQNRKKKQKKQTTAGSSFLKIACKARGLPESHNSSTAFIQIPENCPHGQLVVCSHPECVRSGRQFRYCAICRLPVAKRNFMKRHAHGRFSSPDELREKLGEIGKKGTQSSIVPSASSSSSSSSSSSFNTEFEDQIEGRSESTEGGRGQVKHPKYENLFEPSDQSGLVQNRDSLSTWLSDIFRGSDPLYPRMSKLDTVTSSHLSLIQTEGETGYARNAYPRPDSTPLNELELTSIFD